MVSVSILNEERGSPDESLRALPSCKLDGIVTLAFETPSSLLKSIAGPVLIQIDPTQSRLAEHTVADLGLVGLGIGIDHHRMNDEISVSI